MRHKVQRFVLVSAFATSILATTSCGRRVPVADEDPCAQAQAQSQMARMSQYPLMVRFSEAAAPDCGDAADPGTQPDPGQPAPGPGLPDPQPAQPDPQPFPGPGQPYPGPDPSQPYPGQPDPGPGQPGPGQPGPGQPDPGQPAPGPGQPDPVQPTPGPGQPAPAPPAPPAPPPPTESQLFFEALKKAGVGEYTKPEDLAADIQKMATLKSTGFSKGKFETVEENVQSLWDATRLTFAKIPTQEEYPQRAMAFASSFSYNYIFFVDVAATKKYGSMYVLRMDQGSHEVIGIHPDEAAQWNAPSGAVNAQAFRSMSADGKIFYYGEERGKWLTGDRFVKVPASVLNGTFKQEQQVMAQNAAMFQARNVAPYYR